MLNSEHAALQLRMEDSRKGKRSGKKGFPTPDPHVDGGNGKKAIVYNAKGEKSERDRKRGLRKKERKKKRKSKELSTLK